MAPEVTDRQLADDVLPAQVDEPAVPVKLDQLLPWHKPRKQLVREQQWIYFARHLIEREKGRPGLQQEGDVEPEVRYLTLPGIDYLDVRQLGGACRDLGCRLTSTGFQSGGEGNPHVARAKVREQALVDKGLITGQSHTFPRRLEEIGHVEGDAYRELKSRGPFHIVNVDACGSIAAPGAEHENRLIDAIFRILELQLELKTGRWLLFLTAHVEPGSIDEGTLNGLCHAIFENADENEDFRTTALPLLNAGEADIREAVNAASVEAGIAFLRLFGLGLAKWFLHLARSKQWEMKTHHPFCYSTMPGGTTPSMVCLAFEFVPPPPGLHDQFQVAIAEPAPNPPLGDMSIRAAEKIREMADADSRIRTNEPLRTRMVENLRNLLEEAGYEPAVLAGIGA